MASADELEALRAELEAKAAAEEAARKKYEGSAAAADVFRPGASNSDVFRPQPVRGEWKGRGMRAKRPRLEPEAPAAAGGAGAGAGAAAAAAAPEEEVVIVEDAEQDAFLAPPTVDEIPYIERQFRSYCSMHAFNNAVGEKYLTRAKLSQAGRQLQHLVNARLSSLDYADMAADEVGFVVESAGFDAGYNSFAIAFVLAQLKAPFALELRALEDAAKRYVFQPRLRYYVVGRYETETGTSIGVHAIAVRPYVPPGKSRAVGNVVIDSNTESVEPYVIGSSAYRSYIPIEEGKEDVAGAAVLEVLDPASPWYPPSYVPTHIYAIVDVPAEETFSERVARLFGRGSLESRLASARNAMRNLARQTADLAIATAAAVKK